MGKQVYNRLIGLRGDTHTITKTFIEKTYRLDDWREYLENSKSLGKIQIDNERRYNYVKIVENIRELSPSERAYTTAYNEVVFGLRRTG